MTKNFTVIARYTLDPATATKAISLLASADSPDAVNTAVKFHRWFKGKLIVVSTGQNAAADGYGSFGTPVNVAVKVDLAEFDTKNLYFYSYNKTTNKYKRIEKPAYWFDKNRYLHFTTELAGEIIISDGPLEMK